MGGYPNPTPDKLCFLTNHVLSCVDAEAPHNFWRMSGDKWEPQSDAGLEREITNVLGPIPLAKQLARYEHKNEVKHNSSSVTATTTATTTAAVTATSTAITTTTPAKGTKRKLPGSVGTIIASSTDDTVETINVSAVIATVMFPPNKENSVSSSTRKSSRRKQKVEHKRKVDPKPELVVSSPKDAMKIDDLSKANKTLEEEKKQLGILKRFEAMKASRLRTSGKIEAIDARTLHTSGKNIPSRDGVDTVSTTSTTTPSVGVKNATAVYQKRKSPESTLNESVRPQKQQV